jgi:hypothetical protein
MSGTAERAAPTKVILSVAVGAGAGVVAAGLVLAFRSAEDAAHGMGALRRSGV